LLTHFASLHWHSKRRGQGGALASGRQLGLHKSLSKNFQKYKFLSKMRKKGLFFFRTPVSSKIKKN